MKTKKIAHIHVWDKKNKGDVAIVLAVQELLKKNIPDIKIMDFPMEVLKGKKNGELEKINSADIVVIGGGGIYYKWFLPYDKFAINKIKKPIVIFGVGYIREIGGKKFNKTDKESVLELNKKAKFSSVRDYRTKEFLKKIGVPGAKIKIIGDSAIFLEEKKITEFNIENERIKIGFNLNYSGWLGFGRYEKIIIDSYNETIKYFKEKHNAEIYYFMHHPDEKNIIGSLKVKDIKVINLAMNEQKYVYGKMDLVIGMMLHSAVISFGAGTPEINVGYDLRNRSFAKFIHSPELVLASDKLRRGDLLKRAKFVFENREKYRSKFLRRKNDIWEKQKEFMDEVAKLL